MAEHEDDQKVPPAFPVEDTPPWTTFEVMLTRKDTGSVQSKEYKDIEQAAGMYHHYVNYHGDEYDVSPLVTERRPMNLVEFGVFQEMLEEIEATARLRDKDDNHHHEHDPVDDEIRRRALGESDDVA
jgi:hypothetical protein